ncbi:MAG TPA: hypothetical protein VIC07_11045 [Acidimicrobiia bacterium]|jgi:hypothetical protein
MTENTADRWHSGFMRLSGLVTLAYWIEYFSSGKVRTETNRSYVEFENAFPLADGYMAALFLTTAHLLHEKRAEAVPVGIAAGSAMTYLAGMDILYNLEHGKYKKMTPEMAWEALMNGFCVIFGPLTMLRLWRARNRLDR